MSKTRRQFLVGGAGASALALGAAPLFSELYSSSRNLYRISLAQWSLHRSLRSGELNALDFPAYTKRQFGLGAVEYVNQFFADRATDFVWLSELKTRAADAGVRSLLIMIDAEGALGDSDDLRRRKAVENHFKWIAAAKYLGCHAIRVNAAGSGGWEKQRDNATDSLCRLAEFGDDYDIDIIVENHGGLSSNGKWLAEVMRMADNPRVGTLPDFGNFHLGEGKWYDRYDGVRELMPFAKAVSAKSHEFDAGGNEVRTDYRRMISIVLASGYRGYIGIEYEGSQMGEVEGIRKTQRLLERVRDGLEEEGN